MCGSYCETLSLVKTLWRKHVWFYFVVTVSQPVRFRMQIPPPFPSCASHSHSHSTSTAWALGSGSASGLHLAGASLRQEFVYIGAQFSGADQLWVWSGTYISGVKLELMSRHTQSRTLSSGCPLHGTSQAPQPPGPALLSSGEKNNVSPSLSLLFRCSFLQNRVFPSYNCDRNRKRPLPCHAPDIMVPFSQSLWSDRFSLGVLAWPPH